MSPEDQKLMTVSIKADQETKMGVITDVKQALRQAKALKSVILPQKRKIILIYHVFLLKIAFY